MTATVIDSPVFRRIFSSEPMRRVFSDEHRVQCYLDIEATPACVQARAGLIPHTTGTDEIASLIPPRSCSSRRPWSWLRMM